jgi:2-iminobutanoate/2-iminopropanoate deaminase
VKTIHSNNAPKAVGAYVQAIEDHGILFTSGQLPIDPVTSEMSPDIREQTAQAMKNIQAIVEEAGGSMDKMIKCTLFIRDMKAFPDIDEVYRSFFEDNFPARCCVEVSALPKGAMIEIEAIASV